MESDSLVDRNVGKCCLKRHS